MTLPTFVDLVEPAAVPATAFARLTAAELDMDTATYRRHVALDDKIEDGTATVEERCEVALSTFCYANVGDARLIDRGEVYSDGRYHYFRAADLIEQLFVEVPELVDLWSVRYEEGMLKRLNCHKAKLEVVGSRDRTKLMHVYRTPWRGGMQGLTIEGLSARGTYWSFDPAAPWNATVRESDVLMLEGARRRLGTMYLTDDQVAEARANPQGIAVVVERPRDAEPIKAIAQMTAEELEDAPPDLDTPMPKLTKEEWAAWKAKREDSAARDALKHLTQNLTPEEEARVAMPATEADMAALDKQAKADAEIRAEDRAEGIAPRRKKRTPAQERNRKAGLRRHFARKAEEEAGKGLDPDFVIPT